MVIDNINLKKKFLQYFGDGEEIHYFFAPGRVNLIGEHIDYNGGFVFPAALTLGITALIRKNNSNSIRMISLNAQGDVNVNLKDTIQPVDDDWGNYPKGVFYKLIKEGYQLPGCDILYQSTLPEGAGLSSSAALEVLTAYMMLKLSEANDIDRIWISKFCQEVENEFIGVNCGIMDQFSVAMGLENSAILLDCNTLQYKYVSLNLNEYSLVIMNTNKKRELADSKYNERRSQCEEALSIISKFEPIENLCQASLEHINKYVLDGMLKKRARHVVTENKRVHDAVSALDKGNLLKFANLLTQSHTSLKYDYEVTGFELDTIVEEALKFKGCLGARMTGAGFGGCAIALVFSDSVEKFKDKVSKEYQLKTNIIPSFYESKIGDGVKEYIVKAGTIYTS